MLGKAAKICHGVAKHNTSSFMNIHLTRAGLAAAVALTVLPALAEDVPPIRRVAVPAPGYDGPRITIQIEPRDETEDDAPELVVQGPVDGPSGWFWSVVPSALEADRRAEIALLHLDAAPETTNLPIASLDALQTMAEQHGSAILRSTIGTEVSPALALAVIAVESAGRSDAVSHAGAQGLMQLIPATADRFGVEDPFDPDQNIDGGVAYLDWLLDNFDDDHILALAGYNAGEGAVMNNGGVPNYAETRDYVPKVLATWDRLRSLCVTVPNDLSDGCVFAVMSARAEG